MNEALIKATNITKKFKNDTIIDDLSYSFFGGKIYGLVGSNGSGKTVFMKILAGFLKPNGGSVEYKNKKLYSELEFPGNMGVLIENPTFLEYLSGLENLMLLANINKKVGAAEIASLMKGFGLDPNDKKCVDKYSLGMRQKIGIIQAVMEKPQILILDEPTNSLDKDSVNFFLDYIFKLKEEGVLVIISSHHNTEINMLCDEIIQFPYYGEKK